MAGRDRPGLTRSEGRKFGLTVGGAFLALSGILWWRGHVTAAAVAAVPGVLLAVGGLLIPARLGPVERGWMALASAISRVTTPVVLSLIYLLVLTPAGILRRVIGGNPVLGRGPGEDSYWRERDPSDRKSDLERQF